MNIVPNILSAIYSAAVYIKQFGPQTSDALFAAVDFGLMSDFRRKLNHAFDIGWLRRNEAGEIDLTDSSRLHFSPKPATYMGEKAPPAYRGNVFASSGLSKRYIPNSRGLRPDSDATPTWSQRPTGFGVKSITGSRS